MTALREVAAFGRSDGGEVRARVNGEGRAAQVTLARVDVAGQLVEQLTVPAADVDLAIAALQRCRALTLAPAEDAAGPEVRALLAKLRVHPCLAVIARLEVAEQLASPIVAGAVKLPAALAAIDEAGAKEAVRAAVEGAMQPGVLAKYVAGCIRRGPINDLPRGPGGRAAPPVISPPYHRPFKPEDRPKPLTPEEREAGRRIAETVGPGRPRR